MAFALHFNRRERIVPEHLLVGGTLKISKSLLPIAAVLSMAAGLITAVPAQAAVVLPAGCTGSDYLESKADVGYLDCTTLGSGVDLTVYPNLTSLTIGGNQTGQPTKIAMTRLPKMPASLEFLSFNTPKVTDYSGLAGLKNLTSLDIAFPSNRLNLKSIASWHPRLEELSIGGLKGAVDASPLGKLKNLQSVALDGALPNVKLNEGTWTSMAFPKAPNGQAVLPENYNFTDDNGKPISTKFFNYDSKTSKIRLNSAFKGSFSSSYRSSKPTAAQPRLKHVDIFFFRLADVATKSEWAQDKKMKLVLRGTAQVGKTVTAQLSDTSNPFKAYVDAWQWYRNGKAIKGATKASYKLAGADVGKKITVKATDNKDKLDFGVFRIIPYSVTITATHKAQYGFVVHKPSIAGTALPGKTLTAKFKKWGGSPTRYSYQWYRNGKAIKSATRSTYKATNADKGQKLAVKVTGSKKNYQTASSTSAATSVAKMLNTQKPSIRYGQVFEQDNKNVVFSMIASKGKWNFPATKYSYQWYRNGRTIKGATEYGLVVRTGTFDDKTKFTVKVTAKSKYGTASAISNGFNRWK